MIISSRISDRFLSIGLYAFIAVGMVWFGSRMVNHSLDLKFYNDYLTAWEMALMQFNHQSAPYPLFSGGNHSQYMQQLVTIMNRNMSPPPRSNTEQPFLYVIDKVGHKPQNLFLLAFSDRIVIYNLPPATIEKIDRLIDGKTDLKQGRFIGRKSKDSVTYIGVWKL